MNDAVARHRVGHAVPHILIEAAQDVGGAHDLRDLSAQALEQRSEFNRVCPPPTTRSRRGNSGRSKISFDVIACSTPSTPGSSVGREPEAMRIWRAETSRRQVAPDADRRRPLAPQPAWRPTALDCRCRECPLFACAVRRRRFLVGASPTRRTLQPEATGAVMEVTTIV
jgi:hypothetical protein